VDRGAALSADKHGEEEAFMGHLMRVLFSVAVAATGVPLWWVPIAASASPIGDIAGDTPVVAFGEQAVAYYGQTFVAPNSALDDVTIKLATASGPGDLPFRVLITETSGGTGDGVAPTSVVFESATQTLPFDGSYPINRQEFTLFTVSLQQLRLNAGQTYALILDAFTEYDGVGGSAGSAVMSESYLGGHFFYYGDDLSGGRANHFANAAGWIDWLGQDLAFQIRCLEFPGGGATGGCFPGPGPFPAPEPATLALAALGLTALGFSRRRRK
jgi:hypothetical protein